MNDLTKQGTSVYKKQIDELGEIVEFSHGLCITRKLFINN